MPTEREKIRHGWYAVALLYVFVVILGWFAITQSGPREVIGDESYRQPQNVAGEPRVR